jgi:regulator-associated protein of mTOR
MRAKSDFGPRRHHQEEQSAESPDEDTTVDGHFKIRHGWDDQLNSEEYNNLLTSVRTASILHPST